MHKVIAGRGLLMLGLCLALAGMGFGEEGKDRPTLTVLRFNPPPDDAEAMSRCFLLQWELETELRHVKGLLVRPGQYGLRKPRGSGRGMRSAKRRR
jgi:hypothetical protein